MYEYELEEYLQKFKSIFARLQGIFAIDQLPDRLPLLDCIIVNTE